jgi:hypothetical protein
MDSLLHADIFFLVTTVAMILITIVIVIALIYVIKILRDVSSVSKKVKNESDEIINDIKLLRGSIKTQGLKMSLLKNFFGSFFKRRKKSSKE